MNQLSIGRNVSSPNNVKTKDDIPILSKPKPKSTVEKVVKTKPLHEKFKEELEGVFAFRNDRRVRRQTEPKPKKTSIEQSEKQALNEISEHDADQTVYNRDNGEDVSAEIKPESKTPQHNDDRNRSHTSELAAIDQQSATTNEQKVADKPDTHRSHEIHSSNKTTIKPKHDNQKQTETETSILNPLQMTAMLNELKDSILLVDETDQQTPDDNRAINDNINDSRSRANTDNLEEAEKTNRSLLLKELTDSVVLLDDTEDDHAPDVIKAPDTTHNTYLTPQDDLDFVTLEANSQSDGRRHYQKKLRPGNKSGNSKEGSLSSKTSNNTSRKSKTESKRFQKSVVKAFDSIKRVITSRRNSSESDTCNDEKQTTSCICDLDLHQGHHNEACPHSSRNKQAHHVTSGANNDMVIHTNNREKEITVVENINQKGIYTRQRSFSASCIEIQRLDEESAMNDPSSLYQSHNDNSGSRTKKEKRRKAHYHKRTPGGSHLWKDELTHGYSRNKENKFLKIKEQHLRANSMDNSMNVLQQHRRLVADGTGFRVISDATGSLNTSRQRRDYNKDETNCKPDDNNNIPALKESTIYKALFRDQFPEAEKVTRNPLYSSDDEDDYVPNSDHAGKESDSSDISLTSKPTTESPTLEDSGYSCSKEETRCRPGLPLSPLIEIKNSPQASQKPPSGGDVFTFSPIPIKTMVTPAAAAEESGYRSDMSYSSTSAIPPAAVLNITPQIMQLTQKQQGAPKPSNFTSSDESHAQLTLLHTHDKVTATPLLLSQNADQYVQSAQNIPNDTFINQLTEFTPGGGVSVTYHCGQDEDINSQVATPVVLNTNGDFLDVSSHPQCSNVIYQRNIVGNEMPISGISPQHSNVIYQRSTLGREIPIPTITNQPICSVPNQSHVYLSSVGSLSRAYRDGSPVSNPTLMATPTVQAQNMIIAQAQHAAIASPLQVPSMVTSTPHSVNPAYHIRFSRLQGGYTMGTPVATTPVQPRFELVQACSTPVVLEQNSSKGQNMFFVKESGNCSVYREPPPVQNVRTNPALSTSPKTNQNIHATQHAVTMTTNDGDTGKTHTTNMAEPNNLLNVSSTTHDITSPKNSISESAKPTSLLYGPRGFKSPGQQPMGKWSCVVGPAGSNKANQTGKTEDADAADAITAPDAARVKFSKSGATSPDDIAKLMATDKDLIAL